MLIAVLLACVLVSMIQSKVDEALLKETGAKGVIMKGKGVQVVYGPHVTIIKNEITEIVGE